MDAEEAVEVKPAEKKPGRKPKAQVKKEDDAAQEGENGAATANKAKRKTKAKTEEEPAVPIAERNVGHAYKIGAHVSASGGTFARTQVIRSRTMMLTFARRAKCNSQ